MLNKLKRFKNDTSGQAAVIVAIVLVVLLGFAAFAVDIGYAAHQKSVLQNAADSAALAGAMSIHSSDGDVRAKVAEYVDANVKDPGIDGLPAVEINRINNTVKVTISQETPKFFAGVISSGTKIMKATATAKTWAGEALPFINLDEPDYSTGSSLVIWEPANPGDKERIVKTDAIVSDDGISCQINYEDGISIKEGKANAEEIKQLLEYASQSGEPVYLFSLSSDVINQLLSDPDHPYNKLHTNSVVGIEDIILLKVEVTEYDDVAKLLYIKVLGVYEDYNNINAEAGGESRAILIE